MKDFNEHIKKLSELMDPTLAKKMASEIVEVNSGGGFINVKINHLFEIIDIKIDDSIFVKNDKTLLERLLVETLNSAIEKVKRQSVDYLFQKLLVKDKE